MFYDLIVCRSLTYAQRTASVLEHSGIRAGIMRIPRSVSKTGCGYCVKVLQGSTPLALDILNKAGLPPKATYLADGFGGYREGEL